VPEWVRPEPTTTSAPAAAYSDIHRGEQDAAEMISLETYSADR
jgi:hypothetical protein